MRTFILLFSLLSAGCSNEIAPIQKDRSEGAAAAAEVKTKDRHWEGAFTNGMKETFISFDVSPDGKKLSNLTFKGYWRCNGKLTQDILGPEESFQIKNGVVDGVIIDKEAYIRYELKATLNGNKAEGTFRMSITGLGCDTYVLKWTASPK
ncbi:MAG: hypothetical protein M3Q06_13455 [Bacteroidota bacterium]|nr:hypothetical protein [Bacteroidota bacterium]